MNVVTKKRSLEIILKKKAVLEFLHEFETEDNLKRRYALELQNCEDKSREVLDRLLLIFEKSHFRYLNNLIIDRYDKIRKNIVKQYNSCKNCKSSRFWPDGTEIKPEEKGYCGTDQNANIASNDYGETCTYFEFYSQEIQDEFNRKLTYINKKINQINREGKK